MPLDAANARFKFTIEHAVPGTAAERSIPLPLRAMRPLQIKHNSTTVLTTIAQ